MKYYIEVLKKYVVFSGRAARKEYWFFVLFNSIITIILMIIDSQIGFLVQGNVSLGWLSGLYSLAALLPSLGVTVRRLHDTSRSGWWIFIALIPFVGGIILLVFTVLDSKPGENKYGANPKGVTA